MGNEEAQDWEKGMGDEGPVAATPHRLPEVDPVWWTPKDGTGGPEEVST